jgi:hypothetical protein
VGQRFEALYFCLMDSDYAHLKSGLHVFWTFLYPSHFFLTTFMFSNAYSTARTMGRLLMLLSLYESISTFGSKTLLRVSIFVFFSTVRPVNCGFVLHV